MLWPRRGFLLLLGLEEEEEEEEMRGVLPYRRSGMEMGTLLLMGMGGFGMVRGRWMR